MTVEVGDPFGTAGLRAGVLAAWRDSPTRLREDSATEADLVRAGYRDRVLTELAQNAADAAAKAGVPGRIAVWLDGGALHVANTGVPLDVSGVHALTALRASAKSGGDAAVGRFGVGFTAVLSVADAAEFRSSGGSVRFSRADTLAELAAQGIAIPEGPEEFLAPALRLAWPAAAEPVAGFDSEIVLRLRADVDADALIAGMRDEAVDLLLELPALREIRIGNDEISCATEDLADGLQQIRIAGVDEDERVWWQYHTARARWLLPVRDGRPVATGPDVLRAPTRSDEELSLPALLIADIAMQPDRRRLLPGAHIAALASGYADFARALPPRDRLVLVPLPGFARSEADSLLREALIAELREHEWLPVLGGSTELAGSPARSALPDVLPEIDSAETEFATATAEYPAPSDNAAPHSTAPTTAAQTSPGASAADSSAAAQGSAASAASRNPSAAASRASSARSARTAPEQFELLSPAGRPAFPVQGELFEDELDLSSPPAAGPVPDGAHSAAAQTTRDPDTRTAPGPTAGAAHDNDTQAAPGPNVQAAQGSDSAERRVELPPFDELGVKAVPLGAAGERSVVREGLAAPKRASVFTGVTAELAPLLAEMVGPLVIPELSGRNYADALAVLDVHRVGLVRVAELSSSLEREPQWWYSLYDALDPFAGDPLSVEELGALSVPLVDGRVVTGPRTVVLDDQLETAIPVHWARLAHPEAAHELLGRLGARTATPEDLLSDPALQAILEDDPSDPDTVEAVLGLARHANAAPGVLPTWLGLLELPDVTGESAPADELLLPDAPLARVLVEDSPFTTVDPETVERYGADALRAIGVGWGFTLVTESDPTGPEHHLDDEETWWETLAADPRELVAVRDLDLVDEAEWPEALRLLLDDQSTRALLADRDGYTAWWLRQHACIDGIPLGLMRHPDDKLFAGLLPQLPGFPALDLTVLRGVLAAPEVMTPAFAEELLDALADPARMPLPEAISQTHQLLAEAFEAGRLDLEDLSLPDHVRALSGAVVDSADAMVLDRASYGPALPADRLVVGDIASAAALSDLLGLPLASEVVTAEVVGSGRPTSWAADPLGVLLRLQFDLPAPAGELVLHDDLRVRFTGAYEATVPVTWWEDGDTTHVQVGPRP
ncbi:sacsin N-terminal ATP-binding-like domain-containing protein [Nocardia inohanensis]|uniref:sacsin N-terminal ATP-binding-like domain-containing protein n=1 Tax=Nocardia inohanensis TaxID=209246 RepID=UPI000B2DBE40|nr:hypothetical protein [Nocardia inohanensis]